MAGTSEKTVTNIISDIASATGNNAKDILRDASKIAFGRAVLGNVRTMLKKIPFAGAILSSKWGKLVESGVILLIATTIQILYPKSNKMALAAEALILTLKAEGGLAAGDTLKEYIHDVFHGVDFSLILPKDDDDGDDSTAVSSGGKKKNNSKKSDQLDALASDEA